MPEISVEEQPDGTYKVEVSSGPKSTSHVVSVPGDALTRLGAEDVTAEDLVRASFSFLLEREPPTSILARFGLDDITRYFPEYPGEIRRRLGSEKSR